MVKFFIKLGLKLLYWDNVEETLSFLVPILQCHIGEHTLEQAFQAMVSNHATWLIK